MTNHDVGKLRRGPWLNEEDEILTTIVRTLGEKHWDALAKQSGLRRSGKSCRLRWMNYLRPNLKHGKITLEEEHTILNLHKQWGNKWSRIAKRLPGRTDNEIKNYWRSHLKKKSEAQQGIRNHAKQDMIAPKCDKSPDHIVGGSSNRIFGTSSSETPGPSNLNACWSHSPYENRLLDFISLCCWPNDDDNGQTSEVKHHDECMGAYPCFCQLGSSCEESERDSVWDLWSPIWEMG